MKIGDYPKELVVGQPFDLYVHLGNHEGHMMYYQVLVKLGDREGNVSDAELLDAPLLSSYEAILEHGGNQTIPVSLSLAEAGLNRRLVFELYAYDSEIDGFVYHSRWCQLWLNVTSPPS